MAPVFISVGPITLFNFSIFMILGWLFFSFVFWRKLKDNGVDDEKIFDLTFYSTLVTLIVSRLVYVLVHPALFATNLIKIFAVWVAPGLSLYGALFGVIITCVLVAKRLKIRLGYVLDSLGFAILAFLTVGSIGSLLDGSVVGKITTVPWAISYVGHPGLRHPVQLYDIVAFVFISIVLILFEKRSAKRKLPYGLVGIMFFLLFALSQFMLEFVKETFNYWGNLTLNQWTQILILSESLGALFIKTGANYRVRYSLKEIYGKFSKRTSRGNQTET